MPAKRSPPQQLRQLGDVGGEAVALWGKAGQRSLARSALVEAVEQLTRALDLIASLTATPAIRREQIKLQVALITPLIHVKGYAAPETKEAAERARLLIEQAQRGWRASRRPAAVILGALRILGRQLRRVQRRGSPRACGPIPGVRPEANGNSAAHDRASPNGSIFPHYWRRRARPKPIRSGDCTLRSRRAYGTWS